MSLRKQCAALNCPSTNQVLHKFPTDTERCRIWAERAGCLHILEQESPSGYFLCGDHFLDHSYTSSERTRLLSSAVPQVFHVPVDTGLDEQNQSTSGPLSGLCRLCAGSDGPRLSLFGTRGAELRLVEKIHVHLPILVTPRDVLPLTVCEKCRLKLEICDELVTCSLQADAKLKSLLEMQCGSVEGPDTAPDLYPPDDLPEAVEKGPDTTPDLHLPDDLQVPEAVEKGSQVSTQSEEPPDTTISEVISRQMIDIGGPPQGDPSLSQVLECLKKKRKKPRFKVFMVKLKNMTHVSRDEQIARALEVVKQKEQIKSNCRRRREVPREVPREVVFDLPSRNPAEDASQLSSEPTSSVEVQIGLPEIGSDITLPPPDDPHTIVPLELAMNLNEELPPLLDSAELPLTHMPVATKQVQPQKPDDLDQSLLKQALTLGNSIFCCMHCTFTVMSRDELTQHIQQKHPDKVVAQPAKDAQRDLEVQNIGRVQVTGSRAPVPQFRFQVDDEFTGDVNRSLQSKIVGAIQKIMGLPGETKRPQQLGRKRRYKCKLCTFRCYRKRELRVHNTTHPELHIPCTYCPVAVPTRAELREHEKTAHPHVRRYMCEVCGKEFCTRSSLMQHLAVHRGEMKYQCSECGKKYLTKTGLSLHLVSHSSSSYLCDICGKSVKYLGSLRIHKMLHKDPDCLKRFACDTCGKRYQSRYRLTEHRRVHSNERPFVCSICEKSFQKANQLKQHLVIHANKLQYQCPICEKRFNRRGNMLSHAKKHTKQAGYTCKICQASFLQMGELLTHRRQHTEIEVERARQVSTPAPRDPRICQICGKLLSSKATLRLHMMTHTGDKPYTCGICGKGFTVKNSLLTHERNHRGEKPFRCSFCEVNFTSRQSLVIHERLHTGERPFPCTHCSMTFRSRVNLNQHLVVHSDARPHMCPHCDKGFRRRDTLDAHVRTHTGERPYACKVCGRRFKQKGDCNKHESTTHPKEPQGKAEFEHRGKARPQKFPESYSDNELVISSDSIEDISEVVISQSPSNAITRFS